MKELKVFPNRKWVIRAVVAFLVIMFLLTFFSNTIMNWSLPQVTLVYSSWGTMTTSLKGTGTIEAITQDKILAKGARVVDMVNFGVYEDVTAGDVIATLAPATDEEKAELKEAQKTLDDLLAQKVIDDMQKKVYDYTSFERAISDAKKALDEANAALSQAQGKDAAVRSAQAEVNAAQKKIDTLTADIGSLEAARTSKAQAQGDAEYALSEAKQNLADAQAALAAAQEALAAVPPGEDATEEQAAVDAAAAAVGAAQADVSQKQGVYSQLTSDLNSITASIQSKNASLAAAQKELETANAKLMAAQSLPSVKDAQQTQILAQRSYDDSVKSLADQKKSDEIQQLIDKRTEEQKKIALDEAQKKVDDLTALYAETSIVAAKSGRISAMNISAGSQVAKGDVLVVIDVIENGFKVPMAFTADQVKQIQIGMGARIDGWGGSDQDATAVTIKPDPADPRNSRIVTFLLNNTENMYWFSSGTSITLVLNSRSQDYTCVVPLSAVHEESGETFVYAVKTKPSPLGDRYIAVKVPVTVLAKDDTSAALDPAALSAYGSAVISESNDKSFKSGDQVRIAEGL